MFVDLSVEDGSDLYLNQISFLTLTVAHSSSLSTPLTHINTHTHICMHTPQLLYSHTEKVSGLQKQTVSSVGFFLMSVTINQTRK